MFSSTFPVVTLTNLTIAHLLVSLLIAWFKNLVRRRAGLVDFNSEFSDHIVLFSWLAALFTARATYVTDMGFHSR